MTGRGLCVVFDRGSGRVLRTVQCEPGYECDQVFDPTAEDYLVVDALSVRIDRAWVVDGKLVDAGLELP
jgi:hypothetical protein